MNLSNMFGLSQVLGSVFDDSFICFWKVPTFLRQYAMFATIWCIWLEYMSHIFYDISSDKSCFRIQLGVWPPDVFKSKTRGLF